MCYLELYVVPWKSRTVTDEKLEHTKWWVYLGSSVRFFSLLYDEVDDFDHFVISVLYVLARRKGSLQMKAAWIFFSFDYSSMWTYWSLQFLSQQFIITNSFHFLPIAQSRKFNVVVVVFLISANEMAWAPLGPRPWCLMFISSLVMCSIMKETGMMPSWEQASRYALRPENRSKIGNISCLTSAFIML